VIKLSMDDGATEDTCRIQDDRSLSGVRACFEVRGFAVIFECCETANPVAERFTQATNSWKSAEMLYLFFDIERKMSGILKMNNEFIKI
jgi:hypothetical protein